MDETHALLGGLLRIMQPAMYHAGINVMRTLRTLEDLRTPIDAWGSPFTSISIISNRETPLHRDSKSRRAWMDMLVSLGDFVSTCMELRTVGVDVTLTPGTMVGMSSMLIRHGVSRCAWNRVCVAWYMRNSVHAYAQEEAPS